MIYKALTFEIIKTELPQLIQLLNNFTHIKQYFNPKELNDRNKHTCTHKIRGGRKKK